ncbi:hypothetical protein FH972_022711 [Carpinus fangiana]|uniref:Uncharacterized protein n=1 Tax=Carpinus fangiana TaxID=176857 RepID=A0A5N6KT06_9ROSI|nr:hypothetical protein FH972_022711 [Carpinus fangiana]
MPPAQASSRPSQPVADATRLADFRIKNLNAGTNTFQVKCNCTPPLIAVQKQNKVPGLSHGRSLYFCPSDKPCGFFQWEDAKDRATHPASVNGVVRSLPKSRYDSLIRDNPDAALRSVQVGSSFELEQRLGDPINPALAPKPASGASSVHPDDLQLLHTFELSTSEQRVRQLWQSLQASRSPVASQYSPAPTSNHHQTDVAAEMSQASVASEPAQAPTTENPQQDQHKPLLELFEAELAKLVPSKEPSPSPAAPAMLQEIPNATLPSQPESTEPVPSNAAEPQAFEAPVADPDASVPRSGGATPASPGALFTNTLHSLITGLGSIAARVDERNPQIREQILQAQNAGQEAALGVLSRLIPEIQSRAAAAGVRAVPGRRGFSPAPEATYAPADGTAVPASPSRNRSYEAERILASRYICYDNLHTKGPRYRQYLVRWAGCGPADDVWYDEDNLKTSCQPLIDQFECTRALAPMSANDAAQLHRRTAGNRMMASTTLRKVNSSLYPIDSRPSGPNHAGASAQMKSSESSNSARLAQAERNSYNFDPADIMTHEVGNRTLRRVTSALPSHSYSSSTPRDVDGLYNIKAEEAPLRRAKSLAFRHLPSGTFGRDGEADTEIKGAQETDEPTLHPLVPSLRRAMTTARAERRHQGHHEARDSLFNNFEASRGRYLPRRAATTRLGHRGGEQHRFGHFQETDKIMRCTNDLVNMGYRRSEAEPVAAICEGDVSKALDQLEEDRKAWLWRSNREGQNSSNPENGGTMPGAWDVYRCNLYMMHLQRDICICEASQTPLSYSPKITKQHTVWQPQITHPPRPSSAHQHTTAPAPSADSHSTRSSSPPPRTRPAPPSPAQASSEEAVDEDEDEGDAQDVGRGGGGVGERPGEGGEEEEEGEEVGEGGVGGGVGLLGLFLRAWVVSWRRVERAGREGGCDVSGGWRAGMKGNWRREVWEVKADACDGDGGLEFRALNDG